MIELAKNYVNLLDEVYTKSACSADLVAAPELVKAGNNANTVIYPQISLNGLGEYSRNSGYTDGAVDVKWTPITLTYDRDDRAIRGNKYGRTEEFYQCEALCRQVYKR